ncbi:hypothetical protein ACVWWN_000081 [Mycobacterium sp. URHB0021]
MYLQSRTKRWLQVLRTTQVELAQGRESIEMFLANAHRPGVRQISERDKRITVVLPLDQIALTHESQPLTPGTWLAETLSGVIAAATDITYGDGFIDSVTALLSAIEQAIPALEAQETEPDSSVDEIVADLERALLVSLVVTLTAHGTILPKEGEWTSQHQRFLNGHRDDLGHYLEVATLRFVDESAPGRVHMQHLVSASDAGMTTFAAGAAGVASVDHHPEILAVSYAQWFAYIFAIWEEQFRGRLAEFWDDQWDSKIRRSDILVDYFGDIRLIRNDFVHNKGICDESANAVTVEVQHVEDEKNRGNSRHQPRLWPGAAHASLDELERRPSPSVEGDNLAIEDRCAARECLNQAAGDLRKASREVGGVPAEQLGGAVNPRKRADAIPLRLEHIRA